jgi:hypothetical protein
VDDLAAVGHCLLDGVHHLLNRGVHHQGAHQRVRLERIPDKHLPVGIDQARGEIVGDRLLQDDAARRGAPLPGSAHRAEQNGARSHREVRLF